MVIAVASGKGGTGKTTVSAALFDSIENVVLLDCDVEEPNASYFIDIEDCEERVVTKPLPIIDESKCNACGKCAKVCNFNALAVLKTKAVLFKELCHSCGGCVLVCPEDAITEEPDFTGLIKIGEKGSKEFYEGKLNIGNVSTPYLIKEVKKHLKKDKINIVDCPPGTSCPMVAAVSGADYVIMVTEPTPFGLNDLIIAVDTVRQLKIPFGVLINKYEKGNNLIENYCMSMNIPVLGRINESKEIARAYSEGISLIKAFPYMALLFKDIIEKIGEAV